MTMGVGGRRWWVWPLALVVLVGASGASWWLGARSQSPDQAAARAEAPVASWITAGVEFRALASTVVMRGDARPLATVGVGVPSSVEGTGVVTRVPPGAGAELAEGAVAIEVSGRPVFVLLGGVPAFRSLFVGMAGADVWQLQLALKRLGFSPETDGLFGRKTRVAVNDWYREAGYGEPGGVAFGEVVFVPSVPVWVQSSVSSVGPVTGGGDGSAQVDASRLVVLAAGELVVTTAVRAGDDGLLRSGMAVELLDEVSGRVYPGVLGEIAAEPSLDASGQLTRAAVVIPDERLPLNLSGVNVRVTVTAAASEGEVLVVPLAAVSSSADGVTRVSLLPDGAEVPVDVPVEVGISADGWVAVEPTIEGALAEGDRVVVGR